MKDRFVFIAAALESIELIQIYVDGYTLPDFLEDRKTQDAVVRNLEIIGQASRRTGFVNPSAAFCIAKMAYLMRMADIPHPCSEN